MARDPYAVLGMLALTMAGGCSGGASVDEAAAAAAAPVVSQARVAARTRATAGAAAADSGTAADSLRRAREMEVMRETFTYQGGERDPFNSLVAGVSAGPDITDLQLVGVYENMQAYENSVVVLREITSGKRHKMRVGDRLARLRLAQIRPREAVFMIQDLGHERRETLSLRKQEEMTP